MSSKFFGNSKEKKFQSKKGGKHKMTNQNNKQKSALKALEGVLYGALASLGIVFVGLSSFP